jgi:hypothetical protein
MSVGCLLPCSVCDMRFGARCGRGFSRGFSGRVNTMLLLYYVYEAEQTYSCFAVKKVLFNFIAKVGEIHCVKTVSRCLKIL